MNKVDTMLLELRVSPSLLGFLYLKSALNFCLEDKTIIRDITKRLYPEVAGKHGTTASRVERAIRHAAEVSWAEMSIHIKEKYFVVDRLTKPTNAEYISTLLLHLNEDTQ